MTEQNILIDTAALRFIKAAASVEQLEYWADLKIPTNHNFYICGVDNRYYSVFSELELRMLYQNHTGIELAVATPYVELVRYVAAVARDLEQDDTPVATLRKKLGREPLKPTLAPDTPGEVQAARAPRIPRAPGGDAPSRPKEGTATGRVWSTADDITAERGQVAGRQEVIAACEKLGINASTASTQYGKWKAAKLSVQ